MIERWHVQSTVWFRQSLAMLPPTAEIRDTLLAVSSHLEKSATNYPLIAGTRIRLLETGRDIDGGKKYPALRVFFFVADASASVFMLWADEYDETLVHHEPVLNAPGFASEDGPPATGNEPAQEMLQQLRLPDGRRLRAFLSYCREDYESVHRLYERLMTSGMEIWFDDVALLPGHEWKSEIQRAVRRSDVVIVCLSQQAINKTGYVQREIREALEYAAEHPPGTVFVIPVRLDSCAVPATLEHLHYVDLWTQKGYDKLLLALRQRSQHVGPSSEDSQSR